MIMSEIIKNTDSRYKYLSYIYNKYNYDNIFTKFKGYTGWWMFIPPELVLEYYESQTGTSYINTLEDYDPKDVGSNWISTINIRHAFKSCNLTAQELFDILVLHINDTDDRPKCTNCGCELTFTGVMIGYGSSHHWNEIKNVFCSRSCRNYYWHSHPNEYPEIVRGSILAQRNSFISNSLNADNNIIAYFYIAITESKLIKYGISVNPSGRVHRQSSYNRDEYVTFHIIKVGSVVDIANLESLIKLELNGHEYIEFNNLSNLIVLIKRYINNIYDPFKLS